MNSNEKPLVSVVTPVYNGDAYLRECIESVLAQTYKNFEYIILNNASKDRTLEIAEEYARKDPRIKVHSNSELLPIIANHNKAFSLISPDSKYTKVVSADDWLFPECLERMVELAEANPSVGFVGSYQLSGGGDRGRDWSVRYDEIPYPSTVTSGKKICRSHLSGEPYVFGAPTSLMYRSDLVRSTDRFYPNDTPEADTSACYKYLKDTDFGFVHQILSYERDMHVRQTTQSKGVNAYIPARLADLQNYGPNYLSPAELSRRRDEILKDYYEFLADSVFDSRDEKFWTYHKQRLEGLGHPLDNGRLAWAIACKVFDMVGNPKLTLQRLYARLRPSALT